MSKKAKIIIVILALLLVGALALYFFVLRLEHVTVYNNGYEERPRVCTIAGVRIYGEIMTYIPEIDYGTDQVSANDILSRLESAEKTEQVKAIILEIDSYGGSPVASIEIVNRIKTINKPVVAVIRDGGASGAYWVASATERIFASELSDIGSIGVTMSYVDMSKLNEKEGYTWNKLSTGPFKDAGDPEKSLTSAERALFERDIKIIFDKFKSDVAKNRGLTLAQVNALSDGSSVLGQKALEKGLIDEIGFLPEAEKYLASKYNIEPYICW